MRKRRVNLSANLPNVVDAERGVVSLNYEKSFVTLIVAINLATAVLIVLLILR